ncbi:MAG: M1 family metallopeptidase, partial [Bacteroidota bacterium]
FNLGVGFDANPHNYGRVWFPCFDNFVERATYDLFFTTSNGRVATSNGALIAEQDLGNGLLQRHWRMDEAIPTYLTCVAVSNYATVAQTFNGINGPVPIRLYAPAGDTNAVKNSFQNLPDALEAFETAFGPHRWNKVGYSMVPFGSGAMEHASNIAYPLSAANGSLAQETLMAHELAHSWWGNLVTCETAGDMWINEGMASFLELVFLEHVYGRDRYISTVNSDHLSLLRYAHHQEGGFRSLTNMPHEYTYGDHTYVKGSIVAHTLRGYMGDAQFYPALRTFLDNNQYQSVNATQLRDELSATSGMDLTDFFDGWVLNGGWPHFAIDSFRVNPTPGLTEV